MTESAFAMTPLSGSKFACESEGKLAAPSRRHLFAPSVLATHIADGHVSRGLGVSALRVPLQLVEQKPIGAVQPHALPMTNVAR